MESAHDQVIVSGFEPMQPSVHPPVAGLPMTPRTTAAWYGQMDRELHTCILRIRGVAVPRPLHWLEAWLGWRKQLNMGLRAEFIAGVEEEWRKRTGRRMTAEEVERVLRRYPGEV